MTSAEDAGPMSAPATLAGVVGVAGADEGTAADGAIVVSILGMFGGMAILAVATVRGHVLQGWRSWLPSAVVATGLVTAAFYSIDRPAYFVMLGLLWGVPWLMLAIAVRSQPRHRPR